MRYFFLNTDTVKRLLMTGLAILAHNTVTKSAYGSPSLDSDKQTLKAVSITDFGKIGTSDDSKVLQTALDSAESRGQPLVIPSGSVINIRGTVYLGSINLLAKGATINIYLDKLFKVRGKALRKNEGAILTKSASGAGYGRGVIRISFDSLKINTIRSSNLAGPKTGLLLENVAALKGTSLQVSARGTGRSEVNPLDFFAGVQGVRIFDIDVSMNNPGGHGGFWIRNFSPIRATADIRVDRVNAEGSSADELVSIFNSGDQQSDLHDISIGTVNVRPSGGGGMGLSIYRNAGDYDPSKMQRISIGQVNLTIGAIGPLGDSTGGFGFKVQKCYVQVGSVSIRYVGLWTPALPYIFGIRFAPGSNQSAPLFIPRISIENDSRNSIRVRSAAMLYGPIRTDKLVVRGSGTGFRQIAYGADEIGFADLQSSQTDEPFVRTKTVRGRLNGVAFQIEQRR